MSILFMKLRQRIICIAFAAAMIGNALADWRQDSGYSQLSAELGAALPTGSGIVVLQSEADTDPSSVDGYMPQTATTTPFSGLGGFAGKTFYADSGVGGGSGHAASVGSNFYGQTTSVAPGISQVHLRDASDFLTNLAPNTGPIVFPGTVSNHSWTASTGKDTDDTYYLLAFDYQLNRENVLGCVPMDNGSGTTVPKLLGSSYHAVSVGLRNGNHSRGGTLVDGVGRMKPDLVVNESLTSYATPAVASAAAMLREKIVSSFTAADHPQAIKAILIAGGSKDQLLAWHRAATTNPYDSVYGAGELNVLNSYHILAQGQQAPSNTVAVAAKGWDYRSASRSTPKRYFFSVPAGSAGRTFSAALTWHRSISFVPGINSAIYTPTYSHLTLKLYAANNLVISGAALDQSNSTLDNVQHLFQRNLPAGQYALEVSSDTTGTNYALAWETQSGSGPTLGTHRDASGQVFLDLSQLDPYVTYTLQQSTDLIAWTTATTVRTADTTPATTFTWQDTSASSATKKFYRLQWTPLR
jgi:hypothetical protein